MNAGRITGATALNDIKRSPSSAEILTMVERKRHRRFGAYLRRPLRRSLFALGLISLIPLAPLPAFAVTGTLQAASISFDSATAGAPEARLNISLTTQNAGPITTVSADVPPGVDVAPTNRAALLSADPNSYVSTPDSANNRITSDIDIRARIEPYWWNSGSTQSIINKWGPSPADQSYDFAVTAAGQFSLTTGNGSTSTTSSTTGLTGRMGASTQVRVTRTFSGSTSTTTFFLFDESAKTWSQVGSSQVASSTSSIVAGSADVHVGATAAGSEPFSGGINSVQIRRGAGSPTAVSFNPAGFNPNNAGTSPYVWKSDLDETWTLNRTATAKSDIGGILRTAGVKGISTSGIAQRRFIDGSVRYITNANSLAPNTAVAITFLGLRTAQDTTSFNATVRTWNDTTQLESGSATLASPQERTVDYLGGRKQLLSTTPMPGNAAVIKPGPLDVQGNSLYFYDINSNALALFDTSTNQVKRVAGNGLVGTESGTATSTPINNIASILADPANGAVDWGTTWQPGITRMNIGSGVVTHESINRNGSPDSIGLLALARDTSGNLWGADSFSGRRIIKITGSTGSRVATVMAGGGTQPLPTSGSIDASQVAFDEDPSGVVVDGAGNFYFSCANHIYFVNTTTNMLSPFAGQGWGRSDGTAALDAEIGWVSSIAMNPTGTAIYVASTQGAITNIDLASKTIATVAGALTPGYAGDGGPAINARFSRMAGISFDQNGNLFISDSLNGRIRKIDTAGNITTVVGSGFVSSGRTENVNVDVASDMKSDALGNTYFANPESSIVQKIDIFGNVSIVGGTDHLSEWDGNPNILFEPTALAVSPDGSTIYVGGLDRTIRKISGGTTTVLQRVPSRVDNLGLALAPNGDLYIANSDCAIRKIPAADQSQLVVIAGQPGNCGFVDNVAALSAKLLQITSVAFGPDGNLYFADRDNNRVRMLDFESGFVSTVVGGGATDASGFVRATSASLGTPYAIAFAPNGSLFVAEGVRNVITEVTPGGMSRVIAGQRGVQGNAGDGAAAINASFAGPHALAFRNNDLLVGSWVTRNLRIIHDAVSQAPQINNDTLSVAKNTSGDISILANDTDRFGGIATTTATITKQPTSGTASVALAASAGDVTRVTYTPNANFVGSDSFKYRVCDITLVNCGEATVNIQVGVGDVQTIAGGLAEGDGNALPMGVTNRVTSSGNYVFSINDHNVIRLYSEATGNSKPVAGNGSHSSSGNGGPAQFAGLGNATGLAIDPVGRMVVASSTDATLRRIDQSGIINNFAGPGTPTANNVNFTGVSALGLDACGTYYAGVGSTLFKFSEGSAATSVDGFGSIDGIAASDCTAVVADSVSHVVRSVTGTTVATIAGTGVNGLFGDSGPATSARLYSPQDVAVMKNGDVVVADNRNNRIRRFSIAGNISTVAGNGTSNGTSANGDSPLATQVARPTVVGNFKGDLFFSEGAESQDIGDMRYIDAAGTGKNRIATRAIGNATSPWDPKFGRLSQQENAPQNFYVKPDGTTVVQTDLRTSRVLAPGAGSKLASAANLPTGHIGQFATGPSGTVFFTNIDDHKVYKSDFASAPTVVAGTGVSGDTGDGAAATSATFKEPYGVAYNDQLKTLYVSDRAANRVRVIDLSTGTINPFAGNGSFGYGNTNYQAVTSTFRGPTALAVSSNNSVLIADTGNHIIRYVDRFGIIRRLVGTPTVAGNSGDVSSAYDAVISNPIALAVSTNGTIYIGDDTGSIHKVDTSNRFFNVAGSGAPRNFSDNATALGSDVGSVTSMQIVADKLMFFDSSAARIRVIGGVPTDGNCLSLAALQLTSPINNRSNLELRLSFTTNADVTIGSVSAVLRASDGTPSLINSFGFPNQPSLTMASGRLTATFSTPMNIKAGVNYAMTFGNLSLTSTDGGWDSSISVRDSGGTLLGLTRGNRWRFDDTGSTFLTPGAGGYVAPLLGSQVVTSAAPNSISLDPQLNPTGTIALSHTTNGNMIGQTLSITPGAVQGPYSAIAPASSAPFAAAAQPANTWAFGVSSGTGSVAAPWSGGNFAGAVGATPILTNAFLSSATNVNMRVKIDYRQPAGHYTSAFQYSYSPGK